MPPLISASPLSASGSSETRFEDYEPGLPEAWDDDYEALSKLDGVELEGFKQKDLEAAREPSREPRNLLDHASSVSIDIPESTLTMPRSLYKTYNPATDLCEFTTSHISEAEALAAMAKSDQRCHRAQPEREDGDQDEEEYYLDEFAVYSNSTLYSGDLTSLHELFKTGKNTLYLDGILSKGHAPERQYRLQHIPFQELSIGGYDLSNHTVGGNIWIRSTLNQKRDIWYKLRTPGIEYIRFLKPFRWLADLAKHFVNYIETRQCQASVSIYDFRAGFADWLMRIHGNDAEFQHWRQQHPSRDFRSAVSVHAEFLWHQASGILNASKTSKIRLFREVLHLNEYPVHSRSTNDTIVTPYIFSLFSNLDCRDFLKAVVPKNAPTINNQPRPEKKSGSVRTPMEALLVSIKPGDVISTAPDDHTSGTKWLHNHGVARWYARVQNVSLSNRGERVFDVTWLYHPSDTPCGTQTYPWDNELFLSNHCSCHGSSDDQPIRASEVLSTHTVEWFGNENTEAEFFVRQIYLTEERRWVALRKRDLECGQNRGSEYQVGDTVLAQPFPNVNTLEPFEIVSFTKSNASLRVLERRHRIDPGGLGIAPNNLVYTDEIISIPISWIRGPCIVRILSAEAQPKTPYGRRGTANCFYITHRRQGDSAIVPVTSIPSFRQGFDPEDKSSCTPLRGLDLFAGCGNLGRGIEESGAVKVKWVNDIWNVAVHTYMANTDPYSVVPFLGSVDLLLEKALKGECGPSVPAKGEVEFISGGSPCQGFSLLTANKSSDHQKKNRSLVASFASFVDFYRPKYGILENVVSIIGSSVKSKSTNGSELGSDYFGQLLCAILGMGYQTQIILGDAWTHGAPQSRSRTFLLFALPDQTLPARPLMSHSHPEEIRRLSLGKMSNGEQFSQREFCPTAFKYVTSGEAMQGLPKIQDGRVRICPAFPDHRSNTMTPIEQLRVSMIPTAPYGMGFAKAYYDTQQITEAERDCFPAAGHRVLPKSRGWTRLEPNRLFATVTTSPNPTDARTGRMIHPSEHRTVSILEIRRAQGVPDDDVLVGTFSNRWKLVGNSVARQSALALGLELRRAICGSLYESRDERAVTSVQDARPEVKKAQTTVTGATEMVATSRVPLVRRPATPVRSQRKVGEPRSLGRSWAQGSSPQCPITIDGDGGERPSTTIHLSETVLLDPSKAMSRIDCVTVGVKRRQSCANERYQESMARRRRKGSLDDIIIL